MPKSIILLLILFFSVSCSRIDLAYDLAPRLLVDSLDDNFDFSSERYNQVRKVIESDFMKNKVALKAKLVDQLDSILKAAEKKTLVAEDIKKLFQSFKKEQSEMILLFKPSFEEVILNMTQDEMASVLKETQEKHLKAEERLKDPKKFQERSMENFEKTMDFLFDDVSVEQKKVFSDFIQKHPKYFELQFSYRKDYLKKFETLFPQKSKFVEIALKYYSGSDELKSSEHLQAQEKFLTEMYSMAAQIWNLCDDDQRQEFKETFGTIKEEISKLK